MNHHNLAVFQSFMPQLPHGGNYNFQAVPGAVPQLPQGGNYNFQPVLGAMPPLQQVVPPIPQVENYNLQVLQQVMPPLPQANATFQQLLGVQPQEPYLYLNTQPSQVYLCEELLKIDVTIVYSPPLTFGLHCT